MKRKRKRNKGIFSKVKKLLTTVKKPNWEYIAIIVIIFIGVAVLVVSYFICDKDAKNIAVGLGTGVVTSALVTLYFEWISSKIEKRKVEKFKRMLLNPLNDAVDKLYVQIVLKVNEYRVREEIGSSFLLPTKDTKEVSEFFKKMQEVDFESIDSEEIKSKYDDFSTISLSFFEEVISQYEALPFESLVIEEIITQEEYDQLKHFELVNECNRCLNILNNMELTELERYKTTVHLMHVMFLFINRLIRIFDFMSSKIEIENKWIKSHLDDIYDNEVYLFSDEDIQQGEERAKPEYDTEYPELYEDTEESEEDRLHRKVYEAIWVGDAQTIKECFPKIDRNNKQIQSELTWSVAKDVMKDKELRKLYYQKYGVKYKLRREKR